ncbi:MAG: hypothetical protein CL840_20435 [Crocinitomicaceae bacterium]|nr:hypothetical protein [Crocinitomicaceae bacterium]|tara:strand:+ start:13369 stop:14607 length:1239 start_codon:yes stop_codon:yes gene_type:complete
MSNNTSVSNSIDHIFRSEYSKLVSILVGKFGANCIDVIEDAIQEALYKAMRMWSYQESPKDPGKWLYRVAHNQVIDTLRRSNKSVEYNPELEKGEESPHSMNEHSIDDDQLMMIFACCHPSMKESEQIMLSLKLLCGFSNKEIARAFMKNTEAVKKAITRAKQKFKEEVGELQLPNEGQLMGRVRAVIKVIYLIFNNGYTAVEGESLLKKDVCEDAIRLALIIHQKEGYSAPELKALLSLMLFNFSRFDARVSDELELLTLDKQDRSKWDKELMNRAHIFFGQSASGQSFSRYHFESAIAREHALAQSFENTNWKQILDLYNLMNRYYPSPTVSLNRIVAIDQAEGAKSALKQLNNLNGKNYTNNHLYYAIKGDLEIKLNNKGAKDSLLKAIDLTDNLKERGFLKSKLACLH